MADEINPNLNLIGPEVGGSINTWGGKLNANFAILDSAVAARILRSGDSMTGALGIIAGSELNPGLFFTGDNTGLYQPAANLLGLSVDGVGRLVLSSASSTFTNNLNVNANLSYTGTLTGGTGIVNIGSGQIYKSAAGRVGIGTSSPSYVLDLQNATGSVLARFKDSDSANNGVVISGDVNGGAVGNSALLAGECFYFQNSINAIRAYTNSAERLRIDSAGNMGLGVTPQTWFTNSKALQMSLGAAFAGRANDVTIAEMSGNQYINASGSRIYLGTGAATLYQQTAGSHLWSTAPSGTAGNVATFTQAMTLTRGGNLLVGTTTNTDHRLSIVGIGPQKVRFENTNDSIQNVVDIEWYTAGTNNAAIRVVRDVVAGRLARMEFYTGSGSNERARITSGGYFKASNAGSYGGVAGVSDQTATNTHIFQSDANLTATAFVSNNTGAGAHALVTALPTGALARHFRSLLDGSEVYYVAANGDVRNTNNSYAAISDFKLKESIAEAPSYLDRFMQVRFVNFNFKPETGYETHKQFGVIAQELEQVFPSLVDTTPDFEQVTKTRTVEVPAVEEVLDEEGNIVTPAQPATTREEEYTESVETGTVTKSVKYSVLALMAGKVIQEQQQIINDLLKRVEAFENGSNTSELVALVKAQTRALQAQQSTITQLEQRVAALES